MIDVSRQVLPILQVNLKEQWKLGAVALANREADATATKVEWKEMTVGAVKFNPTVAINEKNYFSTTEAKEISVPTKNLLVWDVLSVQDKDKKSKWDLRLMVTEIVDSTKAKVQKLGWNDTTVAVTDFFYVETTANEEGAITKERRSIETPRTLFNYTQIIKTSATITWTQAEVNNYDFNDIKAELRKQAYKKFSDLFDWMITSTVRTSIVTSDGKTRQIAGWLLYFANNEFEKNTGEYVWVSTANVKTLKSGWLTKDEIDLAFKYAIENGWAINSVIVNTAQAIALSKLYQDKVNVNIVNGTTPTTVGWSVQILKSPIDVAGNLITNIYLDTKMPQDEAIFFNKDLISTKALKNRALMEKIHEPSGDNDNYTIDLSGEWTAIFRNAKENTYVLKNLAI